MTAQETKSHVLPFQGLTPAEVEASRQKYGANVLTPPPREPWWKQFLEKFDDPVIRILMIAAVISMGVGFVHGSFVEGVGILIAILLATTLAFLNEYRANKEFDILNKVNDDVPIKVIRNGNYCTVAKKDLVVGDVVLVELGEEVPADGRVLEAVSLRVNESRFTGEVLPVKKMPLDSPEAKTAGESTYPVDRLLRGTMLVDGHGIMEVISVGDRSEIGKIAAEAYRQDTGEETPLNMQLERLSKLIGVVGLGVAALIYVALIGRDVLSGELQLTGPQWYFTGLLTLGVMLALVRVWLPIVYDGFELAGKELEPPAWLEGDSLVDWLKTFGVGAGVFALGMAAAIFFGILSSEPSSWLPGNVAQDFLKYFMIAVTVIVVAVPEGLAMSVTLSLAYSMRKMTAANNLVRRMHACETIGAATVICSDKTGTLTLNEMRVHQEHFPSLNGRSLKKNRDGFAERLIVESICANSTANLSRVPGEATRALGNPTEGALLFWLEEQGIDYVPVRADFPVTYQWTFSTEKKYMGTLGTSRVTGRPILHVKGAPEIVLDRCATILTGNGAQPLAEKRSEIEKALKSFQARGMRTLGFAYHEAPRSHDGVDIEHLATDMTWLGFVAIADPIRPEVPPAVQACREAGISVKIVTGDNPETAQEIARQIGLWDDQDRNGRHLSGQEFARLGDEQASLAARDLKVLSRARPMDKMRLVKLLQDSNQVVAVTGDGTNDAPALNYANVGLAMGKTGTSVAKEASDIILLDDSFRSIVNAVMWGRSLYENIQRFILFQLTINVAALGIAFLGPFIGVKVPLTVIQMLWVNLIMDTFAALALATEPPHPSVMRRPPRNPEDFIVTGTMAKNIFTVAGVFLVAMVVMLLQIQKDGEVSPYELSVFFTVFVLLQFWNLFNARCLGRTQSAFAGIMDNKSFLIIALAILLGQVAIVNFGGEVFRMVPLTLRDWVVIFFGTSLVLWAGELWRFIKRLRQRG